MTRGIGMGRIYARALTSISFYISKGPWLNRIDDEDDGSDGFFPHLLNACHFAVVTKANIE